MNVDECVAYLRRFLEEGHIPGLTPSDELLARFREKCVGEFRLWEELGAEVYMSERPADLGIHVENVREPPRWHPCTFAFLALCQELEEEELLKIPAAAAYDRFDGWLQKRLSPK